MAITRFRALCIEYFIAQFIKSFRSAEIVKGDERESGKYFFVAEFADRE